MDWLISGGDVLCGGRLARADLALSQGLIAGDAPAGARRFDAAGLLVLPGLVDIHGDAHERQMQPRPGISVPPALALRDSAAQLLAAGITTAFLGVTLSWEPGLRGIEAWRATLASVEAVRAGAGVDLRIHCRFEVDNLDVLDELLEDMAAGRVHLLAYNDHTPGIMRKLGNPSQAGRYAGRAGVKTEEFLALADRAVRRFRRRRRGLRRLRAPPASRCSAMTTTARRRAPPSAPSVRSSANSRCRRRRRAPHAMPANMW